MISRKTALAMSQMACNQIEDELGINVSNETVRRIIERWLLVGHVEQTPAERLRVLRNCLKNKDFSMKKANETFRMIDYLLLEITGEKL